MPFVNYLVVMNSKGCKPTLKNKPEGVELLTMEEVELEGAKPENSESLSLQSLCSALILVADGEGWGMHAGGHVMCLLFCNQNVSLFGPKFVDRYSCSFTFSFDSCSGRTINPD